MQIIKPENIKLNMHLMVTKNVALPHDRSYLQDLFKVIAIDLPYITCKRWSRYALNDKPIVFLVSEHEFGEPSMGFIELSFLEAATWLVPESEKHDTVKVDGELRNWKITDVNVNGNIQINGDIYDDAKKRFDDGSNVTTSAVKHIDMIARLVITKNSIYRLA